jgi:hypothetical protein
MYMSLEACCCSSNLRFNLYCLMLSAFFSLFNSIDVGNGHTCNTMRMRDSRLLCLYLCSPTPPSNRSQTFGYVTRVAVNVPGVTSMLHELRDLKKKKKKSSAKTYTCQYASFTSHRT